MKPLDGVLVLDLTRLLPGNYCTWLLSSLGAEVVKVEDVGAGDYMRSFGTQLDGAGAPHHLVNRGKRSVALNLKDGAAREAFLRLLDGADVLIESFRPGVMDRLGLGPAALRERRPSLVYVSLTGFGQTGPLARVAGHDLNYLAFSGVLDRLGRPGAPPSIPPLPLADLVGGGLVPALGIAALLVRARATGEGAWLDASLAEGVALLPSTALAEVLAGAEVPGRGEDEYTGGSASYSVYELQDGYLAIGAIEQRFWAQLCQALELSSLVDHQHDPDQDEIRRAIAERCKRMTKAEAEQRFDGLDACAMVVSSYEEMLQSETAVARGFLRREDGVPIPVVTPPFVVDGRRLAERGPAPRHGEHTRAVLLESGMAPEDVDALVRSGAAREG